MKTSGARTNQAHTTSSSEIQPAEQNREPTLGAGSSSSGSCYTSSAAEGGTDDDEELSIRVNDLVPPVTRRAEYEMEWEEKPALMLLTSILFRAFDTIWSSVTSTNAKQAGQD